ncbi:Na(+)/H(+) antiporter NhaA 3 [Actinorhabdospora filicis]|uniref:Na(+)/H(+) antiporter NhaA n=1 Tax=Actinorhabdospora filicis TaxID=1785913 RepID=A0A9W6W9L1_9ACTN|nr:Na+/H+ antiporter NhaA [Actinorhabdospora filicis]GLZ77646.1 Na(+)/H(+) antiporter NhaA 3 [Actinorhabdospora filicis]
MTAPQRGGLLGLLPLPERNAVTRALRTETVGGIVLLIAAVLALVWANSPWGDGYASVRDFHLGFGAFDLSIGHWASDGLLTLFFLVAGIELKRELVVGELRRPAAAAVPVVAAVCGIALPALIFTVVAGTQGGDLSGWAVPIATDIAFALAVLAVIGTHLPAAVRAFLLTLAVVDDLCAILVIAIFYTASLDLLALAGAVAGLVVFWLLQRFRVRGWYLYIPLGLVIWGLMLTSGVHATVAGVAMGLLLRARPNPGEEESPGEQVEHAVRPLSAGVAVPLFALFSAGVSVSGTALAGVFTEPEPLGVVLGLVVGKTIGIFAGTYLVARFTRLSLNPDLAWRDVFSIAVLAGIGFTVSLLITELAFTDPALTESVKAAVLIGSLIAALLATVLLKRRNRHYSRLCEEEEADEDGDGVPDVYQR